MSPTALVKREFKLSNVAFVCWILRIVDETGKESFWFKGTDIASFLGYKYPKDAIRDNIKPKWKKFWQELKGALSTLSLKTPSNWQPHSIFISEPGLYALITRSKLPKVEKFTDWVYEDVLPTLRQEGQYRLKIEGQDKKFEELANVLLESNRALIHANQQLITANTNLERARLDGEKARQDAVILSHRLADIAQDVIVKPSSQQLLHTLAVHELSEYSREIAFTRCQRRSLTNALKRLSDKNPGARELYRNGYVPNGVNVLNCVKDCLKRANIPYTAKNNVIKFLNNMSSDEIVSFVHATISSPNVNSLVSVQ